MNSKKWLVIGIVLLVFASANAFAAVDVTLTSSGTAVINKDFEVTLKTKGSDAVGAFDLTVSFDVNAVTLSGITPTPIAEGGIGFSAPAQVKIDEANTTGTVALSYLDVTMAGYTPTDGTDVCTLTFTAKTTTGTTAITPGGTLTKAGFPPANVTGTMTAANVEIVDKIPYTVTASATPSEGGGISNPGEKTYYEGDTPEYTITVNEGYRILSFLVNGEDALGQLADNKYKFAPLAEDATIDVSFIRQYKVTTTVEPSAGGSIASDSGADTFDAGTKPTYTVTVNEGYRIKEFSVNGEDSLAALTADNKYTFPAGLSAAATIDVSFILQHTVAVTVAPADAGTVVSDTGSNIHDAGTTPTYTITPDKAANYVLDKCLVNGADITANLEEVDGVYTYKFPAMGADATIDVTFKLGVFTVTLSQPKVGGFIEAVRGENTVNIDGNVVTVVAGMPQQFVIRTDGNYSILGLKMATADDMAAVKPPNYDADGKFVLAVDNSYLLTVKLQLKYLVTVTAFPAQGGMVDPAGDVWVVDGDDQDLIITVNEGWDAVVTSGMVGEEPVVETYTDDHTLTLEDVTADYIVEVVFKKDGTFHSADCNMDGVISGPEMMDFVALFKQSGIDGYIYDGETPSLFSDCVIGYKFGAVASEEECSLMPHHSADTNGDCYLSLTEFLDTVVLWKYGYVKDPVTGGFVPATE